MSFELAPKSCFFFKNASAVMPSHDCEVYTNKHYFFIFDPYVSLSPPVTCPHILPVVKWNCELDISYGIFASLTCNGHVLNIIYCREIARFGQKFTKLLYAARFTTWSHTSIADKATGAIIASQSWLKYSRFYSWVSYHYRLTA